MKNKFGRLFLLAGIALVVSFGSTARALAAVTLDTTSTGATVVVGTGSGEYLTCAIAASDLASTTYDGVQMDTLYHGSEVDNVPIPFTLVGLANAHVGSHTIDHTGSQVYCASYFGVGGFYASTTLHTFISPTTSSIISVDGGAVFDFWVNEGTIAEAVPHPPQKEIGVLEDRFFASGASTQLSTSTLTMSTWTLQGGFGYLGGLVSLCPVTGSCTPPGGGNSPSVVSLTQSKSDAVTPVGEGQTTTEDAVVFGATLASSSTNQLRLEVEVQLTSSSFTGITNATSSPVAPGVFATTTATNLQNGSYHWRARAVDASTSAASTWQEFGTPGNTDFVVDNLGQDAAGLAKLVINAPYLGDGQTFGGKGWDYDLGEFVAPSAIKTTGYTYWNNGLKVATSGIGLDCSGLIMWAFDRSFNPSKSRLNNFVKAESADEQYNKNTAPIVGLSKPGDALFFDNIPKDNFIDHVAMYVGEGGGFDVVNAANRDLGIITASSSVLEQLPKFVAVRRVISATPLAMLTTGHSPVDLTVTDPDGFTITPTTTISSDEEYLREIPGVLYYSEMEKGTDGNPIDQVYSYTQKSGDYLIKVIPMPSVSSTATYSLDFQTGSQSTTLAQNVPISQIPSQGYGVNTSGTISPFIPVAVDIKPGSYPNSINLGSNGVVPTAIFGSATFDVHNINPTSTTLASASIKLKGNGQPQATFSDVNGDGFMDLTVNFLTDALELTSSSVKATVDGFLANGTEFKGSDSVVVVPQ